MLAHVTVTHPPAQYVFDFSFSDGSKFQFQEKAEKESIAIEKLILQLERWIKALQTN